MERRKKHTVPRKQTFINFVKEGQKVPATKQTRGILHTSETWEMRIDLGRKLVFPEVVQTTLRPDIVIWSERSKKLVAVELTVPWEERCDEAFERKSNKYSQLMADCRQAGWSAWLFPVEVGSRGFPAQSMWRMLTALGIVGRERKQAIQAVGSAAEKSSSWLWLHREKESWS